ncbi:tripartite tricarboxylate transporter substrate binding protein [Chelatococcus sp. SYSU_G07232]|uniref:Tripartite tricarboxylate transporter substrate binding protein n=1 Tax=Chelatococcus albus TaxID=3047466 RepID=A0ABT7AH12_9HYPH|nr:tripartite tricarboxylate transporter substrate binding protein [Chelatococcus sp. SYSU_G07232]MDJ1158661.1 tripartite tricarboxylate transporter substrate binding protein [Chelatococcus sp. SYSU_G07232]
MGVKTTLAAAVALAALATGAAEAGWKPSKPVEFVVTSGAGGGTDQFARTVQAIITKYNLMEQPVVVVNKGGGSGAEGFVYGKTASGEPHKVIFATNNEYLLPLVAKLAFKPSDLTPVAAMAVDEFLLWVKADSPHKDAKSFVEAAKAKPNEIRMGGSQSKDTDQILTKQIEKATGARFTYVPFKSGGEAAVQLAGGHVDSNTNNPAENLGQLKAGAVRPLCVFSPQRMAEAKVTAGLSWADIPTCKEAGIGPEQYQMPRTVFLPGNVPADAVAYYVGVLKQVREKPEWADYIQRTSQSDRFLTGAAFEAFIKADEAKGRETIREEGWLVN